MSSVVFLGVAAEVLNQQGPFAQHPRREPRALPGNWGGGEIFENTSFSEQSGLSRD